MDNTPVTPEATQKLLEKIGPIRNTHYGGFYDFIPDLAVADTAYTNLALPAHTDTTYFSQPARLQAFHMLSHTGQGEDVAAGGKSLLVDGFKVAMQLYSESPARHRVLSRMKVPWHASGNKGIAIAPESPCPVFQAHNHQMQMVRWNNDDRGVLHVSAEQHTDTWYAAAKRWDELLRAEENEYWFNLEPGKLLSEYCEDQA